MKSDNLIDIFNNNLYEFKKVWSNFTAEEEGTRIRSTKIFDFFR